jgi:hypothetical protein
MSRKIIRNSPRRFFLLELLFNCRPPTEDACLAIKPVLLTDTVSQYGGLAHKMSEVVRYSLQP